MLTLFTTPKPFRGPIATIQRNALGSWRLLHPACEVILFGDEAGTGEVATEMGFRHVPQVVRSELGTPMLDAMFRTAQSLASHEYVAYVNADIILMSDFLRAVERIQRQWESFLMVGQRWDVNVAEELDFSLPDWEAPLRSRVTTAGRLHGHTGIDYFVFSRQYSHDMPPFAVGRPGWDNWFIYRARTLKIPVVDVTGTVMAVHQNHDFSHYPKGTNRGGYDPEMQRNLRLAGGYPHVYTLRDADWVLTARELARAPFSPQVLLQRFKRFLRTVLPFLPPRIR